jgi:NodT family efflux transporter outer membrane factor (OMF) lipoprotein
MRAPGVAVERVLRPATAAPHRRVCAQGCARCWRALLLPLGLALTGCVVGPNYQRPKTQLPAQYRGAATSEAGASIAEVNWAGLFKDEALTGLVRVSLERNFDLRMAAERIEQANAQIGIARANQMPFADLQTSFTATKNPQYGTNAVQFFQIGPALSWELDFWGRLRRLSEAARAQYLASSEARSALTVSLVSGVMGSYFQLLELDLERDISLRTRDVATDNQRLVQLRHDLGAATGLDVSQAQQLLYTATAQLALVERQIGQTEDSLSLLLGSAPQEIPRTAKIEQIPLPPELPAGLPSELITRRPDIRQAEQNLIAANAQIGAARAQFLPRITLTAFGGGVSDGLLSVVNAPSRVFSLVPAALTPIFRAGQIRAQTRIAESRQRELALAYQKSIYGALAEVSDALIGHDRTREQRAEQEKLVAAQTESVRLSTLRYKGGRDSYLQVLDAQRNLFTSQLVLARLRLAELQSIVQLYRALGGGWQ